MFAEGLGHLDEATIAQCLRTGPRVQLKPDPTSARAARAFVRRHLRSADDDLRGSAELLASELVTNGVLHAQSDLTLGVVEGDTCVLLAVSDESTEAPAERSPSLSAEGGRGIALVATIARCWGVATQRSGKIIWCLIDAKSRPPR